jgi:hypothetical protein
MKDDLQRTAACIPIERLDGEFNQAEREHLAVCARCQAERALWQEFTDSVPSPGDGAAVQWIAAEVRRRRAAAGPKRKVVWGRWLSPAASFRWAAAAAAIVLAAGIGYLAWDREPALSSTSGDAVYRSARVEAIAPMGDLQGAPRELSWVAVRQAVRYDVRVLEVDRSVVWSTASTTPHISLPAAVIARCVPGRSMLWEVDALDQSGSVIARSGTQRFRVRAAARGGSE